MSQYPHLQKFNGLKYKTKSGNIATIRVIGPGGLNCDYKGKPTEADMKEIEEYISGNLEGGVANFTRFTTSNFKRDLEAEAKAYRKFLKKN